MALDYLGKSFKYPLQPTEVAQIEKVSDTESIKQSFFVILSTPVGTYFFLEEFGSNLHKLKFEPNDKILESLLRYNVVDAISRWEKRAKLLDVYFQDVSSSQKNIIITFQNKQKNEIDSFVYPFYKELIA